MCNLNIIVKKDYPNETDTIKKTVEAVKLYSFLTGITKNSYERNDEGDGIYLSNGLLIKSKNKVNYDDIIKEMLNSNYIITHQRIATSGKTSTYIQPFENEEFVVVHNGVMSEFVKDDHSDTFVFFKEFVELINVSKGKTRTRKIVSSIKKLLNGNLGYYSIAIYDKREKVMYYFKSYASSISFYRTVEKDFLYITTISENKIFLNMFSNEFKEFDIENQVIYKISVGEKIKIFSVGMIKRFESKKYAKNDKRDLGDLFKAVNTNSNTESPFGCNHKSHWPNSLDEYEQSRYLETTNEFYEEELANIKEMQVVKKTNNKGKCVYCEMRTFNLEVHQNSGVTTCTRICDNCYIKNFGYTQVGENIDEEFDYNNYGDYFSQEQQGKQLNDTGGG